MIELSVVIPTCNRAPLLREAIAAVGANTAASHEIVVVDGASDDETPAVLDEARAALGDRLVVVREEERGGFVRAVNAGFRAARGDFLTWLNDDARPLTGCYDAAIEQLRHGPPGVGLVAMFHRMKARRSIAYETVRSGETYQLMHVRGTLYANFGLGRRELFERLGWFDEGYYFLGADPDFSLKVWDAGLRVVPGCASLIDHAEHEDERRDADRGRGGEDNRRLFEKWALPPRNAEANDFDPTRACTLAGWGRGDG